MREFDAIARRLIRSSPESPVDRVARLRRECPAVANQIAADSGSAGPLIFWGRCRNTDEITGQVIVHPAILESIFSIAQQRFQPNALHAGLQHTYGYLFSLIDTPFGRKRDRWTRSLLASALGLPPDVLRPVPGCGTLLANATWVAGSIAFRDHQRLKWMQRCLSKRVAKSARDLNVSRMAGLRISETTTVPAWDGSPARISLVTDLVRLSHAAAGELGGNWLLVYSVVDERCRYPELITLFTVTDTFVGLLRERAAKRRRQDIHPRYNARVAGFPAEPQQGTLQLMRYGVR